MAFTLDTGMEDVVRIKVIGVGGAGNNVVSRMVSSETHGIEFININTDKPTLSVSGADHKLQIGEKLTHGQGAGSNPDIGRRSAEESRNNIAKFFEDTDMVFITAGMGGGTGTGAAPVVAEIAREAGVLTIGVVTKPFKFEGGSKMRAAEAGIEELLERVDTLLVIPNEKLKGVSEQKITFANAFDIADSILHQAVISIADLLRNTSFINSDFADLKTIMRGAGYAHMGVGAASGKGKVEDAARDAIYSPLMETSIEGARRVLINLTGSIDISMEDVESVVGRVQAAAHPDANIIFGVDFNEKMVDALRVIVIATDFDDMRSTTKAVEPEAKLEPIQTTEPADQADADIELPQTNQEDGWDELVKFFDTDN